MGGWFGEIALYSTLSLDPNDPKFHNPTAALQLGQFVMYKLLLLRSFFLAPSLSANKFQLAPAISAV